MIGNVLMLHGCNNASLDFIYVLLLLYLRVGLNGGWLYIYARFIWFVGVVGVWVG